MGQAEELDRVTSKTVTKDELAKFVTKVAAKIKTAKLEIDEEIAGIEERAQ